MAKSDEIAAKLDVLIDILGAANAAKDFDEFRTKLRLLSLETATALLTEEKLEQAHFDKLANIGGDFE